MGQFSSCRLSITLGQELGTLGLEPISRQSDLAQPVKGAELRGHSCAARMETQPCDRGQVMVGTGREVPRSLRGLGVGSVDDLFQIPGWWGGGSSSSASSGDT